MPLGTAINYTVGAFSPPSFFSPPGFFGPPSFFSPPGFFGPPGFFAPPGFFVPPNCGSCGDGGSTVVQCCAGNCFKTVYKDACGVACSETGCGGPGCCATSGSCSGVGC